MQSSGTLIPFGDLEQRWDVLGYCVRAVTLTDTGTSLARDDLHEAGRGRTGPGHRRAWRQFPATSPASGSPAWVTTRPWSRRRRRRNAVPRPFDRIIATRAVLRIPWAWVDGWSGPGPAGFSARGPGRSPATRSGSRGR